LLFVTGYSLSIINCLAIGFQLIGNRLESREAERLEGFQAFWPPSFQAD
jgi:hypothetical protein